MLPSSHHSKQAITPEYIGSRILNQLKMTGERHLGVPITKAVMSVPAEFDERQRNCTKQAAALAGMLKLSISALKSKNAICVFQVANKTILLPWKIHEEN